VPEIGLVLFDAAATVFLAYGVFYLANDLVGVMAEKRVIVWGPTGRPLIPTARLGVIAFEAIGLGMFTWLTFSAAIAPETARSMLNAVIYVLAFIFELVVIGAALLRAYRAVRMP
jgi:succinate-acetate transporter protein